VFSAQTTCNQGIGKVVYERLPDQQLQGFDDDVVSFWQFELKPERIICEYVSQWMNAWMRMQI
jgi:hypothetical protein